MSEQPVASIDEYPPVPKQLLWMFDGIDRKEAIKMMHDYAASAITFKPSKALLRAWEDVQQAENRALRLQDENEELRRQADGDARDAALNSLAKMFHNAEEFEGEDGLMIAVPMDLWNEGCEAIETLIGPEEELEEESES